MRHALLPIILLLLAGCRSMQTLDREAVLARYEQTVFAEGVVWSPPPASERVGPPPTVVNWWYAGTRDRAHRLVFRSLTWDEQGDPVGHEAWYRVAEADLPVPEPFAATDQPGDWVPLYEASPDIRPPAGLPTVREPPRPRSQFVPATTEDSEPVQP